MTNKKSSTVDIFTSRPQNFTTRIYNRTEKDKILRYMKNAESCAVGGLIFDCHVSDYTKKENRFFEDDLYQWCDQDTYHVEKYDAAVTEEFLKHVLAQKETN